MPGQARAVTVAAQVIERRQRVRLAAAKLGEQRQHRRRVRRLAR